MKEMVAGHLARTWSGEVKLFIFSPLLKRPAFIESSVVA